MGRQQANRGCGICRLLNCCVTLIFFGVGGYLLWYFLGQPSGDEIVDLAGDAVDAVRNFDFDDFKNVLPNLTDFNLEDLYQGDPYVGDNTTSSWPTSGEGGLELELLNALDDTWQDEFLLATDDWENGDPDTLTLTITQGEVDYTCKEIDGLQKVCSGNFGDSGYLGVNVLRKTSPGNTIISSVAKMNEYYLRNADNAKRQYTMCHEIGHGFGLPHTDENFNNPPLGNCMDYTNRPEANMHPDESNYNRLAGVYGTVNRRLGRTHNEDRVASVSAPMSDELRAEYEGAVAELENGSFRRRLHDGEMYSSWQVLEEHSSGAHYERALGDDFTIEVHMLFNWE